MRAKKAIYNTVGNNYAKTTCIRKQTPEEAEASEQRYRIMRVATLTPWFAKYGIILAGDSDVDDAFTRLKLSHPEVFDSWGKTK